MSKTLKELRELVADKYDEIKLKREEIQALNAEVESKGESPTKEQVEKKKALRSELDKLSEEYHALMEERDQKAQDELIDVDQKNAKEFRFVYIDKDRVGDREGDIPKKFSIGKAMRGFFTDGTLEGYEKEIVADGKSEAKTVGASASGLYIPFKALGTEKRDHTDGTATTGGHTVTTDQMSFIDVLRNALVLPGMGAQYLTGLQGDLKFPRKTVALTAAWEGETDAGAESTQTWDTVTMSPNRVGAYADVSLQLMNQSEENFKALVEDGLAQSVAQAFNTAAINGSGASNQPTGVLNQSGIGSVSAADPDGGALVWADIVNLEKEVDQDNALMGQVNYLTNAKVRAELKKIEKASSTAQYLLDRDGTLNGYGVTYSNAVPSNLTKGAGTNLSALIFGAWNNLILGQWGGLDLVYDPYTQKASGLDRILVNIFVDVAVRHPEAFAACVDITTTT